MPILYEPTDRMIRTYRAKLKLAPDATSFLAGLVVGFFIVPITLPIIGYQVSKRFGPPSKK